MVWPITWEGLCVDATILGAKRRQVNALRAKLTFTPPHQIDSQKAPADQSAPQGQECLVNVRPFFVAHAQTPELIQPSEGPFDHPSPSSQSAAMFGVALRKKRDDAAGTQTSPDCLGVITTVA